MGATLPAPSPSPRRYKDVPEMCCSAQVAAAFCSHPLCHLRSEPWGGPRQRGATRITAASLRSHAATASFQAPPPPGLRHGVGGCMGTPPPPQRVLPQPAPQHGDGRQRTQSPGTGSKEGAPKSVPPAVAVHGRNTDQPYRRRAAPFRSPQYPNIPGLGGGGGSVWMGRGNGRDWGTQRLHPPTHRSPPAAGKLQN